MKQRIPFRHTWKDFFSFSTRERRGLLVLFALLIIECAVFIIIRFTASQDQPADFSEFKKEVDEFLASAQNNTEADSSENFPPPPPEKPVNVHALFPFDPNNLSDSGWKKLGFTDRQIRTIKNYQAKGGRFYSKDDVRKMYAVSPEQYKRIEPYIIIPVMPAKDKKNHVPHAEKEKLVIDVGVSDTTAFEKLPMIGAYLASKICRYREALGGFYSVSQVKEVRGISDSVFQIILPHLILRDSSNLRRIDLNAAGLEELSRHPYISANVARVIINFRLQHGNFQAPGDLRKVPLVNDELYSKIAPYLKTR